MAWSVVLLDERVAAELENQPNDIRARFERIVRLIEQVGPSRLPPKLFKHIDDRLWELRIQGRDGIGRALYVTASNQKVVIVRVFTKKTQKTPHREIVLAKKRAEEADEK
jgi:phage-related protein